MKRSWFILSLSLSLGALILIACGGQAAAPTNFLDEVDFERPEPPGEYTDALNPYDGDSTAIAEGEMLFLLRLDFSHSRVRRPGTSRSLFPSPTSK